MKEKIKKFLPDIIILIGVLLILQPEIFQYHRCNYFLREDSCDFYSTDWDKIGVIIALIGIDILIRKYFISKREIKKITKSQSN